MMRKLLAAALLVAAITVALGAVPGIADNLAFACDPSDPECG